MYLYNKGNSLETDGKFVIDPSGDGKYGERYGAVYTICEEGWTTVLHNSDLNV